MTTLAALRERWMDVWCRLAPRDRRALRILGVSLSVTLPLVLAWSIHDGLAERRARLEGSRALLAEAEQRIAARLAAGADISAAPSPLSVRVTGAVQRAGLASSMTTVQDAAGGDVQLALRGVPFDQLTSLLAALARWDGITVVTADIARTQPGRVDASLVLRGP